MKRVWVAVFIFISVLGICVAGLMITENLTSNVKSQLETIKEQVSNDNLIGAEELSKSVIKEWHGYQKTMSTFMPHARLEAIDQSLAALPPLIHYGTIDQFEAECQRADSQIHHLKDTEFPTLANIF